MKHTQGSYITGYVTVSVKGNHPELFFQSCIENDIHVWNIKKDSEQHCSGNIKLADVKRLKKIRRGTNYKLTFTNRKGYPFIIRKYTGRKEIMISLLLSIALVFFLSNIIWEVRITGVPKDLEKKISKQLTAYGIHQGTWTFSVEPPSDIQQKLINDIPELLWVGVHQKGTSYILEGVEKTIVKEEVPEGPRNLVATKKGVIEYMYVSQGLPMVKVNDYVEPGDILVSGRLGIPEKDEDKKDDKKKDKHFKLVAAEGDIIAKTWYETEVTVPLKVKHELLTGEHETKYHLRISDLDIPIWGFGTPEFNDIQRERDTKELYFLKWKLPISIIETTLSEKRYHSVKRNKQEAIEEGIEQAKKELQLQLGPEAKIVSENILHETTENGKVKLILYMSVEEDIAKAEPIDQGD
ncbi:sporulation protein YqfD [Virgibacillus kekensis]|uniref:Sporulation protein YqfD n=1 Tax=Virgibacillus kekensis TaxID=202261 RepID=A0ABV9DMR6_9BACI